MSNNVTYYGNGVGIDTKIDKNREILYRQVKIPEKGRIAFQVLLH